MHVTALIQLPVLPGEKNPRARSCRKFLCLFAVYITIFALLYNICQQMNKLIKVVEAESSVQRQALPDFKAGDDINVHVKIKEGTKERIQQFQGTVIQRKNVNTNGETFTVRKVSSGVGVERIFPLLSPNIDKIEVVRRGVVRRARLYYLRGKQGRAAKVKEKRM